ncbi:MAG TPA: hypothetical protein VIW74_02010 [Pyrinomonadaceae bacterium]
MSSMSPSATSATTNESRHSCDEPLLVAVFAPAFKTSLMSGREAFTAGSKLKIMAVKIDTNTVKVNTGKSIWTSSSRGSCPAP